MADKLTNDRAFHAPSSAGHFHMSLGSVMVSAAASKRLETRSALATSPALRTAKPSKNVHNRPDTQPDDHDKLFRHTRRAGRGCSLLLEAFWLQLLDPEFRRLKPHATFSFTHPTLSSIHPTSPYHCSFSHIEIHRCCYKGSQVPQIPFLMLTGRKPPLPDANIPAAFAGTTETPRTRLWQPRIC